MKNYEAMYVLDPSLEEEQVNAAVEKYSQQVTTLGGQVQNVDNWGKRKLAYKVKDRREGIYLVMRFASAPQVAQELGRVLKISDDVIRVLITAVH